MGVFNIGDMVEWTSQSGSYEKTKRGVVVMTMQDAAAELGGRTGSYPTRVAERMYPGHKRMFDGMQWASGGVMVEVIDTKRGKPKLYMPHGKNLGRIIKGEQ